MNESVASVPAFSIGRALLHLVGAGDLVSDGASVIEWHWARPTLLTIALVLLVPAAALVIWRHGRSHGHLSARARATLSVCRIAVLVILVLILGGPFVRVTQDIQQKPIIAVMLDESASMKLEAGPYTDAEAAAIAAVTGWTNPQGDGATSSSTVAERASKASRLQLARDVLRQQRATPITDLSSRFEPRAYRVARRAAAVDSIDDLLSDSGSGGAAATAGDDETALGLALQQAIDDAGDRPIGGIVLLSDGRSTVGPSAIEVVAQAAAAGRKRPAPVFAVPVGSATAAPDAVLLDVLAPRRVTRGDTAQIVATVGSSGFTGAKVNVELLRGDTVIDTKPITLNDDERRQVQLDYRSEEAGEAALTVRLSPQPTERVTQNNESTITIETSDDRYKVLYLESVPRWDFRLLDHELRRDSGLDVALVMESQLLASGVEPADLPRAAKLPTDVDEWAAYHVIILGDVSRDLLTREAQANLSAAVAEKGVGLIVQAGTTAMPHAYLDAPLGELLPVKCEMNRSDDAAGESAALSRGGDDAPAFAPFRMRVTAEGSLHPAFQLYDSATKNRAVWGQMPPFYWSAATTEAKPGATVLAQRVTPQGDRPLIAEQTFGKGRVVFVGLDTTFRWRREVGSHVFYRFWGQAIRRVARDDKTAGDKSRLEVTPRHVEPEGAVAIELYAVDAQAAPIDAETLTVDVSGASSGGAASVSLQRTAPGRFRGVWRPEGAGDFAVSYASGGDETRVTVHVASSGRELRRPTVDREALGALADATGGALIELADIATLSQRIKGDPTTLTRRREQTVWDNWLTLVLLVGLYCVDVGVRRMTGSM